MAVYRIHPAIGIARLGDSPEEFCISPERPAALPLACDSDGNSDVEGEKPVQTFKDAEGRIKRQAARFQIFVYDEDSPQGRPLKLGDPVEGGGNSGLLADIEWRVHVANKKAAWFEFDATRGETGYPDGTPLRNADVTGDEARQKLIIDPGPQTVNVTSRRRAGFGRDSNPYYAPNFPPTGMRPHDIHTLGEVLTDDSGRLLVLGGHGRSGTWKTGISQPRIDHYANTDGWFDDISDGPVMARLVMNSEAVGATRYIDVEYPAWVLTGYPRYAPEVLDMITLDDLVTDLGIREMAARTDMFGSAGTFADPERIDPTDLPALLHWKAGRRQWNPEYRPWFWRDIWTILFRPDEFSYFTNILQQSNYPHQQNERASFDPYRLCITPRVAARAMKRKQNQAVSDHLAGRLVDLALEPALMLLDSTSRPGALDNLAKVEPPLDRAAAAFAASVCPRVEGESADDYAGRWQQVYQANEQAPSPDYAAARATFDAAVTAAIDCLTGAVPEKAPAKRVSTRQEPEESRDETNPDEPIQVTVRRIANEHRAGILLGRALAKAIADSTTDPVRAERQYLFDLLRKPGEENVFQLGGSPATRTYHLPLMPLLCGDNPLNNDVSSKFLRLTDLQLFLLRQWADGKFINEVEEGFVPADSIDPWMPYAGWPSTSGRDLDRGVLSNLLGGAFCPGGEVAWIIRNPAIWREPYRLKADPAFSSFTATAAQVNQNSWVSTLGEEIYAAYVYNPLSQGSDFDVGLQPGDLTKMSGLPWQADFNECSTQTIDVTYTAWSAIEPDSMNNTLMKAEQRQWETLWWPVHRPMQVFSVVTSGGRRSYQMRNWALGVPQTNAGDLKMVTEWSKLGFVIRNPYAADGPFDAPSPAYKYISVERSEER